MSRNMVAADLHFGHRAILRYRTHFNTIAEHDATIMGNMRSTLNKRDVLWLLGDCFFDNASYDLLRELRTLVSGVKFIAGNHDTDNSKRSKLFLSAVQEGLFDEVHALKKHSGLWLSHAPVHPAELYGKRCVHGHTHSKLVEPHSDYVCVSVDHTGYKPVNMQDIVSQHFHPLPFAVTSVSTWAVSDSTAVVECTSVQGAATAVFFADKRPYVILPGTTRTLTDVEAASALHELEHTYKVVLPFVNVEKLYNHR